MKTKFLLAAMLVLTLSVGSAYASTTNVEVHKTEKLGGKGGQFHKHHHRKFHHHHGMRH
jgi:Spy/CpxP family protein refolding chaperone